MQEYGDLILKVFHKHNFTYCANMDWQTLLQKIEDQNDEESKKLLDILNEQLMKKVVNVYNDIQNNPRAVKEKYFKKFSQSDVEASKPLKHMAEVCRKCMQCEALSQTILLGTEVVGNSTNYAFSGFFGKFFSTKTSKRDHKEDLALERLKMLRDILKFDPSEDNLLGNIIIEQTEDFEDIKCTGLA